MRNLGTLLEKADERWGWSAGPISLDNLRELYEDALEYLAANGWTRHVLKSATGEVCGIGAIRAAGEAKQHLAEDHLTGRFAYVELARHLPPDRLVDWARCLGIDIFNLPVTGHTAELAKRMIINYNDVEATQYDIEMLFKETLADLGG